MSGLNLVAKIPFFITWVGFLLDFDLYPHLKVTYSWKIGSSDNE
jgi:hypothetical protein